MVSFSNFLFPVTSREYIEKHIDCVAQDLMKFMYYNILLENYFEFFTCTTRQSTNKYNLPSSF